MVPKIGLEPTTYALRVRCTTSCAKSAYLNYTTYFLFFQITISFFYSALPFFLEFHVFYREQFQNKPCHLDNSFKISYFFLESLCIHHLNTVLISFSIYFRYNRNGDCMSKIDSRELVDIFKEEMTKKKKKEVKMKNKLEKKMERQEDLEFEKIAREEKRRKEEKQRTLYQEAREYSPTPLLESSSNPPGFFSNVIFGFFLILLLFCTSGYSLFLLRAGFEKKAGIKCILLMTFAIFYLFSFTCKKQNSKRLCAIISSMAISLLMVFLIYIA